MEYKIEKYIKEGKGIHIFSANMTGEFPLHTHNFIEIIYVVGGKAREIVDNNEYSVEHGDIIFINYGSTHRTQVEKDYSYINICFSPEAVELLTITSQNAFSLIAFTAFNEMCGDAGGGKISFSGKERTEIENILLGMLREREEKNKGFETVIENYLNILIMKMIRKNQMGVDDEELDGVWKDLTAYIDSNIGSELSLTALAKKCFYNPSYFSRIFKEKFGVTFVEYISRKRVDLAACMLRETDLTVDEISIKAGFGERSGFYHAFSKYMNEKPSEYRKRYRK